MVLYGRRSPKCGLANIEKMKNKTFLILLALITVSGLFLRLIDYDEIPPPDEAFDELHYAWGGATWIKEGIPKSWSNFDSYTNFEYIERYGIKWRMVSPLIEKPPLYFLSSGVTVIASNTKDIFSTSHSVIRILPIALSIFTIFLTGIFASKIFGNQVGLISALVYATVPTVVLANRMSVTENLITPLALSALVIIAYLKNKFSPSTLLLLSIISTLSFLTKQIGISVAASMILIFLKLKRTKNALVIGLFGFLGIIIYLLIGAYYDWDLFLSLQRDVRIGHTLSGLPEVASAIFRFFGIGPKNHPFLDGTVLAGYILLFSSPLWILKEEKENFLKNLFLIFPFVYLLLLVIGQSGAGPFTFFGWYLYPLFPFLAIVLAKFLWDFYKKPQLLSLILLNIIIGSSIIRFIFITVPRQYQYLWQYAFIMFFLLSLGVLHRQRRVQQFFLIGSFAIFILVNVYTVFNMREIYEYSIKGLDFSLFAK